MCSAELIDKGQAYVTWDEEQPAVMLYNFSKILHVQAKKEKGIEQLLIHSPVTVLCISHAVSAHHLELTRRVLSEPDIARLVK